MNKISYLVLTLAVSLLTLTGCQEKTSSASTTSTTGTATTSNTGNSDIAYVNLDSVTVYYDLYVELVDKLEDETKRAERQFSESERQFQDKVNNFQQRLQGGLISENAAKKEQQELQGQMQILEQNRIARQNAIRAQNQKDMKMIYDKIYATLEEYKAEKGYRIVLGHQSGASVILYGDKELDITESVIDLLNEKYKAENDSASTEESAE